MQMVPMVLKLCFLIHHFHKHHLCSTWEAQLRDNWVPFAKHWGSHIYLVVWRVNGVGNLSGKGCLVMMDSHRCLHWGLRNHLRCSGHQPQLSLLLCSSDKPKTSDLYAEPQEFGDPGCAQSYPNPGPKYPHYLHSCDRCPPHLPNSCSPFELILLEPYLEESMKESYLLYLLWHLVLSSDFLR
jgi:hypothetical protein